MLSVLIEYYTRVMERNASVRVLEANHLPKQTTYTIYYVANAYRSLFCVFTLIIEIV